MWVPRMLNQPQHIKKRCGKNTLEAIERGDRTFEIFVDDSVNLEPGDLITSEEWSHEDEKYTGRRITRKVAYALNTKDLHIPGDEVIRYGVTVYGTVPPEAGTLRSLIGFSYLVSAIVKVEEDEEPEIVNGPFYVPPLSSPPFLDMGILEPMAIEKWPGGLYDFTVMVMRDEKREEFFLMDHFINGVVAVAADDFQAVELDWARLQQGEVVSMDGVTLELADPDAVIISTERDDATDVNLPDIPGLPKEDRYAGDIPEEDLGELYEADPNFDPNDPYTQKYADNFTSDINRELDNTLEAKGINPPDKPHR